MRTVVFDLDGTLADTSADLIAAANACFQARGLEARLDPVADAATAFHGGRAMLQAGFSRAGIDAGAMEPMIDDDYQRLLDFYGENICVHTVLYPGAVTAVAQLRENGFLTTICTNKPEGLALRLLDTLGVSHLFDAVIGADTLPTRKPDPAPYIAAVTQAGGEVARSILIGDTKTDRATAHAAQVPCVLVTFGPDGEDVLALSPDAAMASYAILPALAEQLLPLIL